MVKLESEGSNKIKQICLYLFKAFYFKIWGILRTVPEVPNLKALDLI